MGVEIPQGQPLHLVEQVLPDLSHSVLGHMDHDAGIGVGAGSTRHIDRRHKAQHFGKARKITGQDIVVDEGLEQVRSAHIAGGADDQQDHHQHQQGLVPPQIAHQFTQGSPQVLGLLETAPGTMTGTTGAGSGTAGTNRFVLSHRCSLLPAGTHTLPDKYHSCPSAAGDRPGPPRGRRPSPGSGPRRRQRPPAGR